ncbi:hypothetical protein HYR99_23175 [Candidatus Poribacteria bacterium]|nr:hypothetical protein [Candidatus Poribacteria bacterium]
MNRNLDAKARLVQEMEAIPSPVAEGLLLLLKAMKEALSQGASTGEEASPNAAKNLLETDQKKAQQFDFGLEPDAAYREELMEVYFSTVPFTSVEG